MDMSTQKLTNEQTTILRDGIPSSNITVSLPFQYHIVRHCLICMQFNCHLHAGEAEGARSQTPQPTGTSQTRLILAQTNNALHKIYCA